MIKVRDPFSDLFNDVLEPKMLGFWPTAARTPTATLRTTARAFNPAVDVLEHDDAYEIIAEVPGMRSEDISIEYAKGTLTLSGARTLAYEENNDGMHRIERSQGSFQRHFHFSDKVDGDSINADLKDGLLKVRLAKKPEAAARKISISAE